jgi:hypothetical protein
MGGGGDLRDGKHLLVHRLERIDALLQIDIVWWELGLLPSHHGDQPSARQPSPSSDRPVGRSTHLVFGLAKLLLSVLEGARGHGGNLATQRAMRTPCQLEGSRRRQASPMLKDTEWGTVTMGHRT